MNFKKPLILGIAALAGFAVYKARLSLTEAETSAAGQNSFSNINGAGSLAQTYRNASDARDSGANSYLLGTPKSRSQAARPGAIGATGPVEELQASDSALIEAAAKGDVRKVEKRLADQARVDSRDSLRRTPLMYAAWNGFGDICERLLAAGANPDLKDRDGNSAFDFAAGRGHSDMLEFLLKRTHTKDDEHYREYTQLIQAAFSGDARLLPQGTQKLASINRINPQGQSPLHIAASNGSAALIAALLARGANVNVTNSGKQTPLLWAAWNDQANAVEYLLQNGAGISQADADGNTPLMMAAQNGGMNAVKVLLRHGADRYVSNKIGKTAALLAEDHGFGELSLVLK